MSLTEIFDKAKGSLDAYRIDQILSMCGDGRLKDGSEAGRELKAYLSKVSLEKLSIYVAEVLANSFQDSGFVLQDLVNEIGRRLGFEVVNGRYRGSINKSGQDGVWVADGTSLVVEVKTTDAYRINLTTLAKYALTEEVLSSQMDGSCRKGILVVVGRQDTGDLEAQIRGSRHAWDIRVISVEALIELARLKQLAIDSETESALRNSLFPLEFTRIDHLVGLLSRIAFDAERSVQVEQEEISNSESAQSNIDRVYEDSQALSLLSLEDLRNAISKSCQILSEGPLLAVAKSKAKFTGPKGEIVIISMSKRYQRDYQHYWYAFQEAWEKSFDSPTSILCLGMQGKDFFLKLPSSLVKSSLPLMNKTEKKSQHYWHVSLLEKNDEIFMPLPKAGKLLELSPYKVKI